MAIERAERSRFLLRIATAVPGILLLGLSADAFAANTCPWMNEASASGLLGGNAKGAYIATSQSPTASCTFTQQAADGTRTLRIVVTRFEDDPHAGFTKRKMACQSEPTPLKAIGNETVVCALNDDSSSEGIRAIGRVRDQVFEIMIITSLADDPILTESALKSQIKAAAEQVSGNLF
ncbi:hypothetical protein ACFPT7_04525 [Acidicapsa dinghuensis]|uniref:DUF3558 domain-containing protein n=1 Tax=Acidicapsa dinghuensis TaxID=2218256 RepID=A0ABW1EBZ3_9BACT|nr:hypothetical protein [Acidicapsa dinghuensis]